MVATTRIFRHLPARATAFLPVGPSAGDLLRCLDPEIERVYLVGPRPADGWLPWALDSLPREWVPWQHYLEGQHPVMRYTFVREEHDPGFGAWERTRSVAIHSAETFFPGGGYTVTEAQEAYRTLGACIAGAFDGATLLDTPATTGRELMLRSIPENVEWPVLSDEHQELIRSTSGQARIETIGADRYFTSNGPVDPDGPWRPEIPALYEYDMRLAYAASAWELGAGVPVHDHYAEYMGQQRGRYLVDVIVPPDWDRPFGLLGIKDGNEGWRYPHEPGETFTTWCDGAELHVCAKWGWMSHIIIRERLLFPGYDSPGPLDLWRDRLVRIYNALPAHQLARSGVRSIILHSIGALHASSHEVTRFSRSIDDVPESSRAKVRFEGDYCLWPERTSRTWSVLQHPEWSAAIWARTRARLLDGPKSTGALWASGQVVAFSTDALYLTERQGWDDADRRPGRFRLKRWGQGPFPWPANRNDVIRRRQRATEPRG